MTLTQPIKWHGGKHYFAPKFVKIMPPRCKNPNKPDQSDPGYLHYVEPFAGGLSVLLANDPEGISEVVNDLNGELTNFWDVLRTPTTFNDLFRLLESTPFSERSWKSVDEECRRLSGVHCGTDPARAWKFFVRCRQSLSGRMDSFTGITRQRVRRGMNAEVSAWLNAVEGLPAVHARLKRVLILNRDALDVIKSEDGPRTLFYLDPPYMHETRATTKEYGTNEMTDEKHRDLLTLIRRCRGKVMLSGYRSAMYDDLLSGWSRHDFDAPNNAAGGKSKRRMTECLWTNY